jgi:hypothetical protein
MKKFLTVLAVLVSSTPAFAGLQGQCFRETYGAHKCSDEAISGYESDVKAQCQSSGLTFCTGHKECVTDSTEYGGEAHGTVWACGIGFSSGALDSKDVDPGTMNPNTLVGQAFSNSASSTDPRSSLANDRNVAPIQDASILPDLKSSGNAN